MKKVAIMYAADDAETMYGLWEEKALDGLWGTLTSSNEFEFADKVYEVEESKDGNYYILFNNDEYDFIGAFSSEDDVNKYLEDNGMDKNSTMCYRCTLNKVMLPDSLINTIGDADKAEYGLELVSYDAYNEGDIDSALEYLWG